CHALGARVRWRIDEHQIPTTRRRALLLEPGETVGLHESVRRSCKLVQGEVALRPIEIGARHIDSRRGRCAAACGVDSRSTGVREKIEEAFAARELGDQSTRGPMIEKQASVEIIREIHVEAMRLLAHDIELALACKLLVLRALLLLAPLAHEHAIRRNESSCGMTANASSRRWRAA